MTLTIPYEHVPITIDVNCHKDLTINLGTNPELIQLIFNQLLYNMSYNDIINVITPQSFEQIMEYYKTNYKEE